MRKIDLINFLEYDKQEKALATLETELKEVQKVKKDFEVEMSKQKAKQVSLSDDQIADYNKR